MQRGNSFALAAILALSSAACKEIAPQSPAFFASPAQLQLHSEIGRLSPVTAVLEHGDRVELIEKRRRMVRVRTGSGTLGWADSADLLDELQWAKFKQLNQAASRMPAQGKVAPFALLNVHTDPNRSAPSFFQAPAESPLEVMGHRVTPRAPYDPRYEAGFDPDKVPPDAPLDDWHLLRLPDGRLGWALSRLVYFVLPDEILLQANGAPIMAALPLGFIEDETGRRQHWLLCTVTARNKSFDYDVVKAILWNARRHRYESVFTLKEIAGFYPAAVPPAADAALDSTAGPAGFSILVGIGELTREKRSFVFRNGRPVVASTETVTLPAPVRPKREDYRTSSSEPATPAEPAYWQRLRERWIRAWSL
jgi:hypothetical protein